MPLTRIALAASRVEVWPVGRLIRWQREHRPDTPVESGEVFGDPLDALRLLASGMAPLLVDDTGIVAGRDRLRVARTLQLRELPVIVLTELADEEREAYMSRDRELAVVPPFTDAVLRREFSELVGDGFDGMLAFTEGELAALTAAEAEIELPDASGLLEGDDPATC
jgi:hypothetical protein